MYTNNIELDKFLSSFLDLNIIPGRIILKENVLSEIIEYLMPIGDEFVIISNQFLFNKTCEYFKSNLSFIQKFKFVNTLSLSCNNKEIDRIYSKLSNLDLDGIIAIGGGTIIDIAKILAYHLRKPIITIPTSAATCACATALSVLYDDLNTFSEYFYLNKTPDICLIEPKLIISAKSRLLASGISDAIAKYVEGVWSYNNKTKDFYSDLGLLIANNFTNEILSIGNKAILDVDNNDLTLEVFDIISYNIIASALSSGIAGMKIFPNIAHLIANAITSIVNKENYLDIYHGEGVSFGLAIGSLIMPNDISKLKNILLFLKSINLPISISDLISLSPILKSMSLNEVANKIAQFVISSKELKNECDDLSYEILLKAILESDKIFEILGVNNKK